MARYTPDQSQVSIAGDGRPRKTFGGAAPR